VRIFLGSEAAQQRAERVFVWSIERVRDPAREYEITLMRDLPGFDRRGWTTGFTNYRFAIPALCGGGGRAIYNDVDQIYLCDPAQLFDLDLEERGFRAIAPDDPSVMLIDCARMAGVWTLERARRESKRRLIARALADPDLYAALDPRWNVRDDERPVSDAKLVHFTTLHTQPWRPFPERFVYQQHALSDLWHALERSADDAGFEIHTRARPSAAYATWRSSEPVAAAAGRGDELVEEYFPPEPGAAPGMPVDTILCDAALARLPRQDLPWVLEDVFARARREVRVRVPWDGSRRSADAWCEQLAAKSRRHPKLHWELCLEPARGDALLRVGGARASDAPPSVWVLEDDRPGNTTQSLGLAEALGWPFERKRLAPSWRALAHNRWLGASIAGIDVARSAPLEPPWPDLVIAAGRRCAPVAQWIREASGGRAKLVQLGRKGGDHADLFDLTVTPRYCRLTPHPRRLETAAPLHRASAERIAEARERFARFAALPAPRIGLLVGGTSGQYRFGPADARRIGEQAMALARRAGGCVLATSSRRLGTRATQALREALEGAPLVHVWRPDGDANPYLGILAWADALVVSADSESMLAEASSLGKPLFLARLPERASFRALSLPREWVWRRGCARPPGPRGTPRPQRGLERLCARLVEQGFVRPSRDLSHLHEELIRRGVALELGAADAADVGSAPRPGSDLEAVVARVRELMGVPADRTAGVEGA
jgi:hypothetical protein